LDAVADVAIGHLPTFSTSLANTAVWVNDSRFTMDADGWLHANTTFPDAISGQQTVISILRVGTNDIDHSIVTIKFIEPDTRRPHFSRDK
uniref:Cadherin domain-containing protein n=1 Tax=Gongylonema pulchrum TaxID=637853 RepID=A0A183EY13_9BILA